MNHPQDDNSDPTHTVAEDRDDNAFDDPAHNFEE